MERKVPDARGVGEGEGSHRRQRRAIPRRDGGRQGGWNRCVSVSVSESDTPEWRTGHTDGT